MAALNDVPFVKGHGTGNDFVVIPDLDGVRGLSADQVRFLCDRHTGIGADGVLRIIRTEYAPESVPGSGGVEFFMDYRNADGSVAEMCGNGARVFVRYLQAAGLITGSEVAIGTRGGVVNASLHEDESITIDMGRAVGVGVGEGLTVRVGERTWAATGVHVPNPHAVVFVESLKDAGDLLRAPLVTPQEVFPDGVNVEFVTRIGPDHVAMRVHERGVGETLSCGTGACAVAWVARRSTVVGTRSELTAGTMRVDVPGGCLRITETAGGNLLLNGPADLIARGTVRL